MDWRDIAAIVFACTAVNHLGLISAIERVIKHSLPVINCPKCLTFWSVLAYGSVCCCITATPTTVGCLSIAAAVISVPAISLLCSYLAIWLELLMYTIDTLYNRIYGILENNNKEERDES